MQRLLFWGCNTGIRLGQFDVVSRQTIRDCEFACFSRGIDHRNTNDLLTVDNCNFAPQLLSGNANQQKYIQGNAYGIFCSNLYRATFTKIVGKNISDGIHFSIASPTQPQRHIIDSCDFESCYVAITDGAVGAHIRISNLSVRGGNILGGVGAGNYTTAVFSGGNGSQIDIISMVATEFEGPAISIPVFGTAVDLRMSPACWIDDWNKAPPVSGLPNPSPAMYAVSGHTVKYSTITRFTNSNGGPNTGGGGTFATY